MPRAVRLAAARTTLIQSRESRPKLLVCRLRVLGRSLQRESEPKTFSSCTELTIQIFDLLDAVLPSGAPGTPAVSGSKSGTHNGSSRGSTVIPRGSAAYGRGSSAWAMSGAFNSSMNLAALANGGAGVIRIRALALKNDPEGSGKYIAGLNEIRVRTREVSRSSRVCPLVTNSSGSVGGF